MLNEIEFESSLKSDHEIRKENEKKQQELVKGNVIFFFKKYITCNIHFLAGKIDMDSESEKKVLQSAQDFEDLNQEEISKFTFASRITDDDKKNNLKSLDRKLDDTLFFLCEHTLGKDNIFLLPQGKWQVGETLRQTAERIAKEKCGPEIKLHFYGNAPVGFYKYKYPQSERNEVVGAKVFFFRAIYKSGNISNKTLKYEWINDNEMKGKLKDAYYESVKSFCCI